MDYPEALNQTSDSLQWTLQVMLIGQRGVLRDTPEAPNATKTDEEEMER